jgi:hypothetical protein
MVAIFALGAHKVEALTLSDFDDDAYVDVNNITWSGSSPFSSSTLSGVIEWAVFRAEDFPAVFTGYTPTADQLTYTYQMIVTGTAAVSSVDVFIELGQPANNIGSFTGGGLTGKPATLAELNGIPIETAFWEFDDKIATGQTSVGLAFSSPNIPLSYAGKVIDSGIFADAFDLPSPSGIPIPEPTSTALSLVGLFCLGISAFGRACSSKRK